MTIWQTFKMVQIITSQWKARYRVRVTNLKYQMGFMRIIDRIYHVRKVATQILNTKQAKLPLNSTAVPKICKYKHKKIRLIPKLKNLLCLYRYRINKVNKLWSKRRTSWEQLSNHSLVQRMMGKLRLKVFMRVWIGNRLLIHRHQALEEIRWTFHTYKVTPIWETK